MYDIENTNYCSIINITDDNDALMFVCDTYSIYFIEMRTLAIKKKINTTYYLSGIRKSKEMEKWKNIKTYMHKYILGYIIEK